MKTTDNANFTELLTDELFANNGGANRKNYLDILVNAIDNIWDLISDK